MNITGLAAMMHFIPRRVVAAAHTTQQHHQRPPTQWRRCVRNREAPGGLWTPSLTTRTGTQSAWRCLIRRRRRALVVLTTALLHARGVPFPFSRAAQVAEFGLTCKSLSDGKIFATAPEKLTGRVTSPTKAQDVYSFGTLMYEMFMRMQPTEEHDPHEWLDSLAVRPCWRRRARPRGGGPSKRLRAPQADTSHWFVGFHPIFKDFREWTKLSKLKPRPGITG